MASSVITVGLSQINVGTASKAGVMPVSVAKIGKTYKDTCKLIMQGSEVAEYFQEGKSVPKIRSRRKKMPVLTFSLLDPDIQMLADYIGGEINSGKWGYEGDGLEVKKAIRVESSLGFYIYIPYGDIEAIINSDFSTKGIFLVDFKVTPCSVISGKSLYIFKGLVLLSFGILENSVDPVGTIAESGTIFTIIEGSEYFNISNSTGNITFSSTPDYDTRSLYNLTVKSSIGATYKINVKVIGVPEYVLFNENSQMIVTEDGLYAIELNIN